MKETLVARRTYVLLVPQVGSGQVAPFKWEWGKVLLEAILW